MALHHVVGGFYGASVSKLVMGSIAGAGILKFVSGGFGYHGPSALRNTHGGSFASILGLERFNYYTVCLLLLLHYNLRRVERHFGARKVLGFTVFSIAASSCMQVLFGGLLRVFGLSGRSEVSLHSCSIGLAISLLVQLHGLPTARSKTLYSVKYSEKTISYLLGLQLSLSGGLESLVAAVSGSVVGCIYFRNVLRVQDLRCPSRIASLLDMMLMSDKPIRTTATSAREAMRLRRQALRVTEYETIAPRGRQRHASGQGYAETLLGDVVMRRRPVRAPEPEPEPPAEEDITTLTDMGFTREQATGALVAANNDVQRATNQLLDL